MVKKQEEKVEEVVEEQPVVEETTEDLESEIATEEEKVEDVIVNEEKPKGKKIRGYIVTNPKQPKGVYMQTIELDGVKFNFYEGRGCLINAKLKNVADKFKKEKGFKVEPFYGIKK